jgi:hypothetical protein
LEVNVGRNASDIEIWQVRTGADPAAVADEAAAPAAGAARHRRACRSTRQAGADR